MAKRERVVQKEPWSRQKIALQLDAAKYLKISEMFIFLVHGAPTCAAQMDEAMTVLP